MRQAKRVRSRRRGGFTLLEVLLVVGILALLAAFVVPSLIGTGDKAKHDLTVGKIGAMKTPIELFHQHVGRYPKELKELVEKPSDETEAQKWAGPYVANLDDLKDAWEHEFKYLGGEDAKGNPGTYDVWSVGKDGEDGTDDDITNWTKAQ
jgi:general secretion pathway protein G